MGGEPFIGGWASSQVDFFVNFLADNALNNKNVPFGYGASWDIVAGRGNFNMARFPLDYLGGLNQKTGSNLPLLTLL